MFLFAATLNQQLPFTEGPDGKKQESGEWALSSSKNLEYQTRKWKQDRFLHALKGGGCQGLLILRVRGDRISCPALSLQDGMGEVWRLKSSMGLLWHQMSGEGEVAMQVLRSTPKSPEYFLFVRWVFSDELLIAVTLQTASKDGSIVLHCGCVPSLLPLERRETLLHFPTGSKWAQYLSDYSAGRHDFSRIPCFPTKDILGGKCSDQKPIK